MKKFVAVAGNIGVGKSTLVAKLCERLGWQPFYEPEGENPYLTEFYQDMRTWAFHSQIFFLTRRLRAHRQQDQHQRIARKLQIALQRRRHLQLAFQEQRADFAAEFLRRAIWAEPAAEEVAGE